jgi:hypothetical protein
MNIDALYDIINETTVSLRKGAEVEEREIDGVRTVEIMAMPPESEVHDREKVDVVFFTVGVDKAVAERRRPELEAVLAEYPEPDRLIQGPSFIEVGAVVGDQEMALRLFGLGKALGMWDVITPAVMGMTGEAARQIAASGFLMMGGWPRKER